MEATPDATKAAILKGPRAAVEAGTPRKHFTICAEDLLHAFGELPDKSKPAPEAKTDAKKTGEK